MVEQDSRRIAEEVYRQIGTRYGVSETPLHDHNDLDTPRTPFSSISQFVRAVHWTIPSTDAATAANYGVFWVADAACAVTGMMEVHQTAGTDAGAVTLQLERLTGTEALDAGDALLVSAFNLKSTANTVQSANIVKSSTSNMPTASLMKGNRLALKDSGTLTAVANVTVVVFITYQ